MKIALTSCSKIQKNKKQKVWKQIQVVNADALALLGDFVYLDEVTSGDQPDWQGISRLFDEQFYQSRFLALRASGIDLHAIWDDHDFHSNNSFGADLSEEIVEKLRQMFLSYFDKDGTRKTIYYAADYDNVRVIFLDVRSYRERDSTILGAEQEAWFEEVLDHDKKYTAVCSGSTLNSRRVPIGGHDGKTWAEHKPSLDWISELLSDRRHTLFLSGDIHKTKFVTHNGGAFHEVIASGAARKYARGRFATINFGDDVEVTYFKKGRVKRTMVIDGESWQVVRDSRS